MLEDKKQPGKTPAKHINGNREKSPFDDRPEKKEFSVPDERALASLTFAGRRRDLRNVLAGTGNEQDLDAHESKTRFSNIGNDVRERARLRREEAEKQQQPKQQVGVGASAHNDEPQAIQQTPLETAKPRETAGNDEPMSPLQPAMKDMKNKPGRTSSMLGDQSQQPAAGAETTKKASADDQEITDLHWRQKSRDTQRESDGKVPSDRKNRGNHVGVAESVVKDRLDEVEALLVAGVKAAWKLGKGPEDMFDTFMKMLRNTIVIGGITASEMPKSERPHGTSPNRKLDGQELFEQRMRMLREAPDPAIAARMLKSPHQVKQEMLDLEKAVRKRAVKLRKAARKAGIPVADALSDAEFMGEDVEEPDVQERILDAAMRPKSAADTVEHWRTMVHEKNKVRDEKRKVEALDWLKQHGTQGEPLSGKEQLLAELEEADKEGAELGARAEENTQAEPLSGEKQLLAEMEEMEKEGAEPGARAEQNTAAGEASSEKEAREVGKSGNKEVESSRTEASDLRRTGTDVGMFKDADGTVEAVMMSKKDRLSLERRDRKVAQRAKNQADLAAMISVKKTEARLVEVNKLKQDVGLNAEVRPKQEAVLREKVQSKPRAYARQLWEGRLKTLRALDEKVVSAEEEKATLTEAGPQLTSDASDVENRAPERSVREEIARIKPAVPEDKSSRSTDLSYVELFGELRKVAADLRVPRVRTVHGTEPLAAASAEELDPGLIVLPRSARRREHLIQQQEKKIREKLGLDKMSKEPNAKVKDKLDDWILREDTKAELREMRKAKSSGKKDGWQTGRVRLSRSRGTQAY